MTFRTELHASKKLIIDEGSKRDLVKNPSKTGLYKPMMELILREPLGIKTFVSDCVGEV